MRGAARLHRSRAISTHSLAVRDARSILLAGYLCRGATLSLGCGAICARLRTACVHLLWRPRAEDVTAIGAEGEDASLGPWYKSVMCPGSPGSQVAKGGASAHHPQCKACQPYLLLWRAHRPRLLLLQSAVYSLLSRLAALLAPWRSLRMSSRRRSGTRPLTTTASLAW